MRISSKTIQTVRESLELLRVYLDDVPERPLEEYFEKSTAWDTVNNFINVIEYDMENGGHYDED